MNCFAQHLVLAPCLCLKNLNIGFELFIIEWQDCFVWTHTASSNSFPNESSPSVHGDAHGIWLQLHYYSHSLQRFSGSAPGDSNYSLHGSSSSSLRGFCNWCVLRQYFFLLEMLQRTAGNLLQIAFAFLLFNFLSKDHLMMNLVLYDKIPCLHIRPIALIVIDNLLEGVTGHFGKRDHI